MRLIADITTEEEVTRFDFESDANGDTFEITELVMEIYLLPNESATNSGYIKIGAIANERYVNTKIFQSCNGVPGSGYRHFVLYFKLLDFWRLIKFADTVNTSFGGNVGSYEPNYFTGECVRYTEPIKSIVVYTTANIGVGSKIIIKGR